MGGERERELGFRFRGVLPPPQGVCFSPVLTLSLAKEISSSALLCG